MAIRMQASGRTWAIGGAVLLALGALAVWGWRTASDPAVTPGGERATAASAVRSAPAASGPTGLDGVRAALARGALKGIKPYGNWCVQPESGLQPCLGLRDRFEYYLLAKDEVSAGDLRALVEDDARRANGTATAEQILVVFDRYLGVRQYPFPTPLGGNDWNAWQQALDARHQLRLQGLGADWALAFYGDQERSDQADLARARSGQPAPVASRPPAPRAPAPGQWTPAMRAQMVQKYGEEAAKRMEKAEGERLPLEQVTNQVRREWMRLLSDKSLSEAERQEQIRRFIEQRVDPKDQADVLQMSKMPAR
jgi:lipase chaperone LimK